ncbi:Piso0_001317 [Millerozyma farinosa CBS 7064]|uniref:candidapepsin n=1 Tax=Pichia sorbitophila (strain ATCC MYA-4447 / BCRC 22081 / CBS 7064 / NBRC 10061 / NRRL Y-12695) TaxID=559304 RepID=G8YMU7_PICSO|nr:Piso0_001317 [Millerozyma farinosa CBS 7064]
MRISWVFLAAALSGVVSSQDDYPLKINFNIVRGNDHSDISKRDNRGAFFAPSLNKRDDNSVSVTLKNEKTFYLAELKVGSNSQQVGVLVDTGSSDLWVVSSDVMCTESTSSSRKRDVSYVGEQANDLDKRDRLLQGKGDSVQEKNALSSSPAPTKTQNIKNMDQAGSGSSMTSSAATEDVVNKAAFSISTIVVSDISGFSMPSFTINTASDVAGDSGSGESSETGSCTAYGSFETSKSDSFHKNNSAPAFEIQYADGSEALGVWGYDDVEVGGSNVKDLSFAVVNETGSEMGVLGIGLPGLETTYTGSSSGSPYKYENLPLKMKSQGLIKKSAYSLYLSEEDATSGTVLFGAVDTAKFDGDLQTVKVLDTGMGYNEPIRLQIRLDNIKVADSTVYDGGVAAVLDSGSTLSYFPTVLAQKMGKTLGGKYSSSLGAYQIKCPSSNSANVTFDFGGAKISVPLSELVLSYGKQCYLGILESSSSYVLLGDNFLRRAYVVYDLDDAEVSLAQVNYSSDENIQAISSSVPKASRAPGYSSVGVSESFGGSTPTEVVSYSGGSAIGSYVTFSDTTSSQTSSSSNGKSNAAVSFSSFKIMLKLFATISLFGFIALL